MIRSELALFVRIKTAQLIFRKGTRDGYYLSQAPEHFEVSGSW